MSSTTMFKKMEYMEHLNLVSFYSEEVMVLGTKEKVFKIVEKLREKVKELDQEIEIKERSLFVAQHDLDSVITDLVEDKSELNEINNQLKEKKKLVKKVRKFNQKEIKWMPNEFKDNSNDSSIISAFNTAHQILTIALNNYNNLKEEFDAIKWRKVKPKKVRRDRRKTMLDTLQSRQLRIEREHQALLNLLELNLETEERKIDALEIIENDKAKDLKDTKDGYQKIIKDIQKELKKIRDKRQKARTKLNKAELELKFALQEGEEIEPEILIVAPAQISVYIDMKAVKIEELADSLVRIYIPPIAFNRTLIELPDSSVYDIDGKETEFETSLQGAYFDLFGQLKETVLEKEAEVKTKAIENGIVEDGERMARLYLENFMRPLGLEMEFIQEKEEDNPLRTQLAQKKIPEEETTEEGEPQEKNSQEDSTEQVDSQ